MLDACELVLFQATAKGKYEFYFPEAKPKVKKSSIFQRRSRTKI